MAYRVLIVDDSVIIRKMIVRMLSMLPMEVTECLEAFDGQDAIDKLKSEWVDLVLCDVNMPRKSGEDVVQTLAADPMLKDIPVIIVSSDRSSAREERLIKMGARGYVQKPVTPEALKDALVASLGPTCMEAA